jgi:hypothetical protein
VEQLLSLLLVFNLILVFLIELSCQLIFKLIKRDIKVWRFFALKISSFHLKLLLEILANSKNIIIHLFEQNAFGSLFSVFQWISLDKFALQTCLTPHLSLCITTCSFWTTPTRVKSLTNLHVKVCFFTVTQVRYFL